MTERTLAEKILADGLAPVWEAFKGEILPGSRITVGEAIALDNVALPTLTGYKGETCESLSLRMVNHFTARAVLVQRLRAIRERLAPITRELEAMRQAAESAKRLDARAGVTVLDIEGLVRRSNQALWDMLTEEEKALFHESRDAGELDLESVINHVQKGRTKTAGNVADLAVAIEALLTILGAKPKATHDLSNGYAIKFARAAENNLEGSHAGRLEDRMGYRDPLRAKKSSIKDKKPIILTVAEFVLFPSPYADGLRYEEAPESWQDHECVKALIHAMNEAKS
jgi:hypothetical protein